MAHPQNSSRGSFAKSAVSIAGTALTYDDVTFNSTAALIAVGLQISNSTAHTLTANSTGFVSSGAVTLSGQATAGKLTANATGVLVSGAIYPSGKTQAKISANSTTTTVANAFAVSGQATVGKIAANSTALLLPATGIQMAALTSLKITSNSTGIKIGSRYISTNTTGNSTT